MGPHDPSEPQREIRQIDANHSTIRNLAADTNENGRGQWPSDSESWNNRGQEGGREEEEEEEEGSDGENDNIWRWL